MTLASANQAKARIDVLIQEREVSEDVAVAHQNIADALMEAVCAVYPTHYGFFPSPRDKWPELRSERRSTLFRRFAEVASEEADDAGDELSVTLLLALYASKVG